MAACARSLALLCSQKSFIPSFFLGRRERGSRDELQRASALIPNRALCHKCRRRCSAGSFPYRSLPSMLEGTSRATFLLLFAISSFMTLGGPTKSRNLRPKTAHRSFCLRATRALPSNKKGCCNLFLFSSFPLSLSIWDDMMTHKRRADVAVLPGGAHICL